MAIESQGCVLYWSTTTSLSTVISVGQVVGFNGPTGSANVIDASHLGSTAKEKMIGLRDEGQITLDCNLAPSDMGQVKLRECRAARTQGNWAIKMTDTAITMLNGHGYVSGFSVTGAVDQIVKASITIEISGAVTYSTVA
jgi:hypothetical protein